MIKFKAMHEMEFVIEVSDNGSNEVAVTVDLPELDSYAGLMHKVEKWPGKIDSVQGIMLETAYGRNITIDFVRTQGQDEANDLDVRIFTTQGRLLAHKRLANKATRVFSFFSRQVVPGEAYGDVMC